MYKKDCPHCLGTGKTNRHGADLECTCSEYEVQEEQAVELTKDYKFMDYLMIEHGKDYAGLDDDMPDAFEAWLLGIGPEEIIKYHKEYEKVSLSVRR